MPNRSISSGNRSGFSSWNRAIIRAENVRAETRTSRREIVGKNPTADSRTISRRFPHVFRTFSSRLLHNLTTKHTNNFSTISRQIPQNFSNLSTHYSYKSLSTYWSRVMYMQLQSIDVIKGSEKPPVTLEYRIWKKKTIYKYEFCATHGIEQDFLPLKINLTCV